MAAPFPQPWPYTSGMAVSTIPQTCIDTVRFLIGDTDSEDPLLQDSEIQGLLAQNSGDPYLGSASACRAVASRYAREADKSVGDLRIASSQKAKAYEAMVMQMMDEAQRYSVGAPYAGGIRWSDKCIDQENDDVVAPAFSKGLMDDQGTAPKYGQSDDDGFGNNYGDFPSG